MIDEIGPYWSWSISAKDKDSQTYPVIILYNNILHNLYKCDNYIGVCNVCMIDEIRSLTGVVNPETLRPRSPLSLSTK